jgi:hypothetical protein
MTEINKMEKHNKNKRNTNHIKNIKSIIIILTVAIMLIGCGKKDPEIDGVVDIFDYVTVEFDGTNGQGKANVVIDYDNLELEMVGGRENLEALDSVEDLGTLNKYINVCASLSFSSDQYTDLSNGDVVTVSVVYDEEAAKAADVVFGSELSHQYKVSGLK